MFVRVETETFEIESCYQVLVGKDENIQSRVISVPCSNVRQARGSRIIFYHELALLTEITFHEWVRRITEKIAAAPEEGLFLQITRIDGVVCGEMSIWRNLIPPICPREANSVHPLNGWLLTQWRIHDF